MTERLTCSNCGAPVTRSGGEMTVTCPHCQNVTELPPVRPIRSADDSPRARGVAAAAPAVVPNIVIIQSGPTVVTGGGRPAPVILRRSSVPVLGPLLLCLFLALGITTYFRVHRAVDTAVQKVEKGAEKAGRTVEHEKLGHPH